MDISLDDLVKANRRGGGGRGGGGRGGKFRGGHDNRSGGGGAFRRTRNTQQRNNPYRSNRDQGDSEGVWEHDRFDDEEEEEEEIIETAPVRRSSGGGAGGGLESGSKLQISNLAFSVNDEDIKDLFEPLGDIKKAFVQYDKSGRSLGTATVVFARRASAQEAIKKYNNVPLDGQAMKITLVGSAGGGSGGGGGGGGGGGERTGARNFRNAVNEATRITVSVPNRRIARPVGGRRLVTRGSRGGRGGSGGSGGRGGRGGGRGGRGRQVTKEELDAEMDEYTADAGGDE